MLEQCQHITIMSFLSILNDKQPFQWRLYKMVSHSNNSSVIADELSLFDHFVWLQLKDLRSDSALVS